MTQKIDNNEEDLSLEEFTLATAVQVGAIAELLIEKGLISEQEFYDKMKEVHSQFETQEAKS